MSQRPRKGILENSQATPKAHRNTTAVSAGTEATGAKDRVVTPRERRIMMKRS